MSAKELLDAPVAALARAVASGAVSAESVAL
jgi:hypothetical protein